MTREFTFMPSCAPPTSRYSHERANIDSVFITSPKEKRGMMPLLYRLRRRHYIHIFLSSPATYIIITARTAARWALVLTSPVIPSRRLVRAGVSAAPARHDKKLMMDATTSAFVRHDADKRRPPRQARATRHRRSPAHTLILNARH